MSENSGDNKPPSLETLFAQIDGWVDPTTGAVVPPVQTSTTFARSPDYTPISADHGYIRYGNDMVRLVENILAKAESAEAGMLFPSGMAAVAAVIRTIPTGGSLVLQSGIYWNTTKWAREFCKRRQIRLAEVDVSETKVVAEIIEAFQPEIVFVETPSNPWLKTADLEGISTACRRFGSTFVVDSTAATPVLSQPIQFGADIVLHSATKAINGHSDVLAGFLACRDQASSIWQAIDTDRKEAGAILGSFEAWLLLRGMRTLPLRMERMSQSAQKIAEFLDQHPKISDVFYPGLPKNPGHLLATKQMSGGFGGLLSVLVKGGGDDALNICGKLKLFHRATSLGGVESLVEHRHTIESEIPDNLLRFSIGIENVDDLIADLEQAIG